MDMVMFEEHLAKCNSHPELAIGLEIYVFSVSTDEFEEEILMPYSTNHEQLGSWGEQLYGKTLARPSVQKNADLANTFEATNLSLPKWVYKVMVETMHVPHQWVETSSCVGPFFWSTVAEVEGLPHLQIVYRKSDVRKNGKTRGWELVLSHDINRSITTGFYKGTESSKISECLKILQKSIVDIAHPMLLPILICSRDLSMDGDLRQLEVRETVRVLEKTITGAAQVYTDPDVTKQESLDLGLINKKLVDCHCRALWKRPEAYLDIVNTMQDALESYQEQCLKSNRAQKSPQHSSLEARLKFLRVKLQGISTYRQVTIARLEMLQGLVQNLVSLSIAHSQKQMTIKRLQRQQTHKLEEMKEEDQKARMKKEKELEDELENRKSVSIALVGVFFLPGAFFAAMFSTTFFDFHAENARAIISPWFWVYWVLTVPVTLIVLGLWYTWHRHIKNIRLKKIEELDEKQRADEEKIRKERMQPVDHRTF